MVLRARRPDDVRAQRDGDLHGEEADPAGGAVHEHPVALADVQHLGERLVGGEPGQRQGARLGERQRARLVREAPLRRRHEIGRRPPLDVVAADVAEHLVTGGEVDDGRARLLDDAGDIPARDDREVVRVRAGQARPRGCRCRPGSPRRRAPAPGRCPDRRAARAGRHGASGPTSSPNRSYAMPLTGGPSRSARRPSGSRGGSHARRGHAACRRTSCPSPGRAWP